MYLGSSTNEIDEGVKRIDRIFDEQVLPETAVSHLPASYDIEFRHVSFAYENKAETTRTEALKDISLLRHRERLLRWSVRQVPESLR